MTIEEFRVIVDGLEQKARACTNAGNDLLTQTLKVKMVISEGNIASDTINIDALVAKYGPIYTQKRVAIQAAANALVVNPLA